MSAYMYIEDTLKIVMFFILNTKWIRNRGHVFQVKQALYSITVVKYFAFGKAYSLLIKSRKASRINRQNLATARSRTDWAHF